MSAEAVGWVWQHSPYRDKSLIVHIAIADVVNDTYGHKFWLSVPELARKSRCSERTVQYTLGRMVEDGFLEVVEEAQQHHPRTYRMVMSTSGADSAPQPGVQSDAPRGATNDARGATNDARGATNDMPIRKNPKEPKKEPKRTQPSSVASGDTTRTAEIERLCTLLAGLVEANGSKRPTVTGKWRTECDRLLRLDGREPAQVERVIRWCQSDEFWRANVLSMPKLRERFDQLRLAALRDRRRSGDGRPAAAGAIEEYMRRAEAAG